MMTPHIAVAREEIATFCQQHHIRWLALFGDEVLKEAEVQYATA